MLSHNILAITKVAEHQLPIDILNSQRSTLEGKFWQVNVETDDNVMCTTPIEKMAEVNKALEENKNKVLERYKSCMNSSNNSKTEISTFLRCLTWILCLVFWMNA